jgi:hypothetical protein
LVAITNANESGVMDRKQTTYLTKETMSYLVIIMKPRENNYKSKKD